MSGGAFFGINAGNANVSGSKNTFLGANANPAADNLVNATARDEIVHGPPPALRSHPQGSVLNKRVGIAQIREIFARGALTGLAPARNGLRARRV